MTENELLQQTIQILSSDYEVRMRYKSTIDRYNDQLCLCGIDRYRIGVIGVTSSGKSTMINSILGEKLLSAAVAPSSSQLVTCSKSNEKKVTIYFDGRPNLVLTGSNVTEKEIRKYSDERDNSKNRERVKQLELSTPTFAFSDEILLIDSPGLDAFEYEGHEKLTMESLLPTVDMCIFVTTCKTNSDQKTRSILDTIADYNIPLILVQNMVDSVKASPDGKKTVEEVALEHKRRLENIVNHSRIRDKAQVRIVQISAKLALKSKTEILNREKNHKFSNYDLLVRTVNEVFATVKPRIEGKRTRDHIKELEKLIRDAEQDFSCFEMLPEFEFEGYDKKIENTYKNSYESIRKVANEFQNYRSNSVNKLKEKNITDSDLTQIKKDTSSYEQKLIDISRAFRSEMKNYCEKFNVDQRRLEVIDSFGEIPGLRLSTKQKTEYKQKKGGLWGVARFFSDIFNTNWGWDVVNVTVTDNEATLNNIKEYFIRAAKAFWGAAEKWESSSNTQVSLLKEQYRSREREYNEKINIRLKEEDRKKVIEKLRDLVSRAQSSSYIPETARMKTQTADIDRGTHKEYVDRLVYDIYRLSDKLCRDTGIRAMILYTECDKRENIIIGRDRESVSRFLDNSFGIIIPSEQINSEFVHYGSGYAAINVRSDVCSSTTDRNVFILFNTEQFGSGLGEVAGLRLSEIVGACDMLYFVIQDLDVLINADTVTESIKYMLSIGKKIGFNHEYKILANTSSPLYSIAFMHAQSIEIETQRDEVNAIHELSTGLNLFAGESAKKTVPDIIKGFSKAKV